MYSPKSATRILSKKTISVSAPNRIELGGTWDVKGFALAYEWIKPCTVNFGISLRTTVTLYPYHENKIKITNGNEETEFSLYDANYLDKFRLLSVIASHYGISGYHAVFEYQGPTRSGLGGSGIVAVTFIAALAKLHQLIKDKDRPLDVNKLIYLAHCFEESLNFSITGIQDQCAGVYASVHYWEWHYSKDRKFTMKEILDPKDYKHFDDRLIVAFLGPHNSNDMNSLYVESFFNPQNRDSWLDFNERTRKFAQAVTLLDWGKIIQGMNYENEFRQKVAPDRIIPKGRALWEIALKNKAGFSVCGAGGGGCIWVIAPSKEVKEKILQEYKKLLKPTEILNAKLEPQGLTYMIK